MIKLDPISKIMSATLHTVGPDDNFLKVKEVFHRYPLRHVLVVENSKLLGMISRTDFMRITYGASLSEKGEEEINELIYKTLTAKEAMTKNLVTARSDTSIEKAAKILTQNAVHALPVVDHGKLMGIVTTTDLLGYLVVHAS
ncbi:MAG: CBS domain-containing protein [Cyclobacteriaceae bacterium]